MRFAAVRDNQFMNDLSTLVNTVSVFARIKQALAGLIVGPIFVAAACYGLFWNEGRAVAVTKSLKEGARNVIEVPSSRVEPANDGKLIYVTGDITTDQVPRDDVFGISAPGIRMKRIVETFAWVETSHTKSNSNGRRYSYNKEWTTGLQSTSTFHDKSGHENPPRQLAGAAFWNVDDATLGAFRLEPGQVGRFGVESRVQLRPGQEKLAAQNIPTSKPFSIVDGRIYIGIPGKEKIGDTRISYVTGAEGPGSIVATQVGDGFQPYEAANGKRVYLTAVGTKPATEMFAAAQRENMKITFALRGMGLVFLWVGFSVFLGLFRLIPIGRGLIDFGINFVAGVGAALVGALSIGFGWVRYRPVLGIAILSVGVLVAALIFVTGKRRLGRTRVSGQLVLG